MSRRLETERLVLSPLVTGDVADLHRIFTQPGVRRYLLDDAVVSREWTETEIASSQARFDAHGYGLWGVRVQAGDLIGFAGYREFHEPPELQLLYGLHPDYWGLGLATEAADAVIRYGFEQLGFDRIVASTDAPNTDSIRVLERLRMRYDRREVTAAGLDTVYYALTRSAWLAAQADG